MLIAMKNETSVQYYDRKNKDKKDEKIVGQFLDTYFYPEWVTTNTRNNDVDTQIKGIDLTVSTSGGVEYIIDEKAATQWKNLETFAFEVESYNGNKELYKGWFMDNSTLNNYYTLVWFDDDTSRTHKEKEYHLSSTTQIDDCTVALVNKKSIYDWLRKNHIEGKEVMSKASEMREAVKYYGDNFWKHVKQYVKNIKMSISIGTFEEAVNLLMSRQTLIDLSCLTIHYFKKNGIMYKQVLRKGAMQ